MAQAINETSRVANIKIRAVPSEGQHLNPTHIARDVAELFATDIEGSLRGQIPLDFHVESLHSLIRDTLERRLATMFILEAGAAAETVSDALPVANLKPSEVVGQKLVALSIASLYRSVEAGRFYCVRPRGQTNGRAFPAWQFVESVPELLPKVLDQFQGALETEVHAFFVTARDELNELAPAELLAGKLFEGRGAPHASQRRLLNLPTVERQRRVIDAIPRPGESVAY
ncbi:hypothetical protein BLA18110_07934 [Burkholderia lata]|uniref:hypothetical protein n=1 Tax=Burkholderia lata (strain ATCC 17760 / DSM 23089 / LMG 22485 / NCIMB 9086 / R18194 / 383) TaxID=482957 RepID=UPI00145311C0|nr:hypothetical protein [Burkholderia lata]VWD54270.1 hypothetical protein BLA18110_07934 [Burkholderia lata]